ncbi:hypothetical protein [Sinomonas mesophila]|uniref:hypothetical protein n=1 Tax=Sinomonas mesophila TaxID=1531955 RepID=UPI0009871CA8|nr:hypothetical protein [Sinomonas mesophila]
MISFALCLALSACDGGAGPTVATIDAAGITTERSQQALSYANVSSPVGRGDSVAVLRWVAPASGTGHKTISHSRDAGAIWTDATIDGQAVTDDDLERLAVSPKGWLALGRPSTGPRDRLVVRTSPDAAAFTRQGDGVAVPDGAEYFVAGTAVGWTIVFQQGEEPWQAATSADGAAWTVAPLTPDGLSPEDYAAVGIDGTFSDLVASDAELLLVGQGTIDTFGQKTTGGLVYHSGDGGLTWRRNRYRSETSIGPGNSAPQAAAWTPQGPATLGWGWKTYGRTYPEAVFRAPLGNDMIHPTVEHGLRDGTSPYAGDDELDFSEGVYLAAGDHGASPDIWASLKVGSPGSWKNVSLPAEDPHGHRFAKGNLAVSGGFLSFHAQYSTLGSRVEVFFIDATGTASLRSTLTGHQDLAPSIAAMTAVDGGIEALGYAGRQAAVFRRTQDRTLGAPSLLPSEEPIHFTGLRSGAAGRVAFGWRQLANHAHAVAWTSKDGLDWVRGSEAVLSSRPADDSRISDALVLGDRYLVSGWAEDADGVANGSIAVTTDGASWTQLAPEPFRGSEEQSVGVSQLEAAANGAIVAAGTVTDKDDRTQLRLWRSADGSAFVDIAPPAGAEGAERSPGELVRAGDTLVLAVTEELPEQRHRVVLYESTDHGATWTAAAQDALEADTSIGHDLASDGDEAVLVATVGTTTASHLTALRRRADGSWRTMALESEVLRSERTRAADAVLAGRQLVLSAETGTGVERRPVVVEVTLPAGQ